MTEKQNPELPGKQPPADQEKKPMRFRVEQLARSLKFHKHSKKPEGTAE